ncbi:MAG: DUF2953 domain-containing protein [Clostridia bacterium]|nr:DUF2953 domain-containing protein [Clostridia bacterium]
MLYLAALAYWLLCVRIRVRLEAFFVNGQGGASFSIGALGMHVRRDYALVRGDNAFSLRLRPYKGKWHEKKKNGPMSRYLSRLVKHILLDALHGGRLERIVLSLSLGDACETALAAGAVRALLCALLAGLGGRANCGLSVVPDFDEEELRVHAAGIFSCRAGDIMLAALKAARGKRKEGLKWTSIPLRA